MRLEDFNKITNEAGVTNTLIRRPVHWINEILPYVFGAAGIILLFMLLTSGYQMIFSKGDPKAMQIAQSKITSSLVGIVILFASFWIVQLVFQFLGIDFGADSIIN